MRQIRRLVTAGLLAVPLLFALASGCGTAVDQPGGGTAGVTGDSGAIQGFNFTSWWHDEFLGPEADEALDRMVEAGATWVAIVPTQYMRSAGSSIIAPESGGRSAGDGAVASIIDAAHDRGLRVMLKPHVDVSDGTWRGAIHPDDQEAWFTSYRTMIILYARLAERHGVEMFCIGNELDSMTGDAYNDEWEEIIGAVRQDFQGSLTYGSTIDSYGEITFWPMLDYLGISFYFPLSDAADPTLEELTRGWTDYSGYYEQGADWLSRVEEWQGRWQKPVIFTEIGYRSIDFAARTPWDYESIGSYNGSAQANAYQAAFEVLGEESWFAGMFWWNWSPQADSCGPGNTDYTVCGKPAEEVVRRAWKPFL